MENNNANNGNEQKFQYTGDDVLDVMAKYGINRNKSVETIIRKYLLENIKPENGQKIKLLEFGAGRGEFINRFKTEPQLELFAVELDEQYFKNLASQYTAYQDIAQMPDSSLDGIYLIDVLEHIENDVEMLNIFHQKLKKGGKILIYVPARMELFSNFDTEIGHFRRYHKAELKEKVVNAKFAVDKISYHEIIGYFAAYYNKLFSKKGEQLNKNAVMIYDKFLVPPTNFIERFISPPIGKSLYIIATKI